MQSDQLNCEGRQIEYRFVQPAAAAGGIDLVMLHEGLGSVSMWRDFIALAPHVKVEDLTVRSIDAARTAYLETDLRARLSRHHADVDSAFWGWNRIWLDPAFRGWNIENLLPSIRCPILAIQGENDEYGTLEQIASVSRAAPDAKSLALPACRHSPHRDQAQAVLAAAKEFVAGLASMRGRSTGSRTA